MFNPQEQKQHKLTSKLEQKEITRVFLGGLVRGTTAHHVIDAFARFGLTVVGMMQIMQSDEIFHYCPSVEFENVQHRMKAMSLGKIKINGALCQIRQYREMLPSSSLDGAGAGAIGGQQHATVLVQQQQQRLVNHNGTGIRAPPQRQSQAPPPGIPAIRKPPPNSSMPPQQSRGTGPHPPPPPGLHRRPENKGVVRRSAPNPAEQYGSMRELLKEFYYLSTLGQELDNEMQNIIVKKKEMIKKQCYLMQKLQKMQMYMHQAVLVKNPPPRTSRDSYDPSLVNVTQQQMIQKQYVSPERVLQANLTRPGFSSEMNAHSLQLLGTLQHSRQAAPLLSPTRSKNGVEMPMCRFFLENRCVHGNKCQFSHDIKTAHAQLSQQLDMMEDQLEMESDSESIIDGKGELKKTFPTKRMPDSAGNFPSLDYMLDRSRETNPMPIGKQITNSKQYTRDDLLNMRKENPSWNNPPKNLPSWAPLKEKENSEFPEENRQL